MRHFHHRAEVFFADVHGECGAQGPREIETIGVYVRHDDMACAGVIGTAMGTTILVFSSLRTYADFWMIPLMGFGQLSLFGGYALYFPELFPTRLRSTGTSFCYNVGRFVAASGPAALGILTGVVFKDKDEPLRWAGVTMCAVFLIGMVALPFAPETRGEPLPEEDRDGAH